MVDFKGCAPFVYGEVLREFETVVSDCGITIVWLG